MKIIITGASAGIGFETALQLSANSSNEVIAIARRENKLKALKEEIYKVNPASKFDYIIADISKEDSFASLINSVKSRFNTVDILINNAGLLINKPFEELTGEDWLNVYSTNVFGVVNLIRSLLALMNHNSHIVNISSMGGVQGSTKFKGLSAYSSSKAALINITECLAEELKGREIAVNCLALGSAQTEMFSIAFPSVKASLSSKEMAAFVAEFALTGNKYFNGKVIPVSASTP